MKGFFNKLLRIDMEAETYSYKDIPDEVLQTTLGGKGLGVHLLMKENPVGVDPLSADNVFILATGPVTGTKMWSHSRFGAYSKSPATGGFGESYCGGTLAPKIKGCGVDAVLLLNRARSLKFLVIDENGVTFNEASEIQGAETPDAEKYIIDHAPEGASAMVIGPAGENLVTFACIKSDRQNNLGRSLGRCGMGAVLGAKNCKGIAFAGTKKCDIADENLLKEVTKKVVARAKESPVTKMYQQLGTPMQVAVTNAQQCFPTKYWYSGHYEEWETLSADYMQKNFEVKALSCPTCFLNCAKHSRVKHGRHAGLEIDGPEYETIFAIGGLNMINSLEEVSWLNDICDRLGIDTISAGNISAFAVEAFKAGKIDYEIDYNQPDTVAELYNMISTRSGVGGIFARGIKEAAKELDMEDVAIHVKGLEPAGFDPRVLKGMGLSYATSARGACHLRGTFYKAELSGQMDRAQIAGKAKLHIDYEDRAAIFDSLVLCRFYRDFLFWEELLQLVEATTGRALSKDELQAIANDITNRSREYNAREGLDRSTDTLPRRFLTEPTEEGFTLSEEDLNTMIREYNEIRDGEKEASAET